jgi:hypothetical protein
MKYSLARFSSIPEAAIQKLSLAGITDSDQLLAAAATPASRKRLAQKTGMDPQSLQKWASLSDLVRVKGIGPQLAEKLVESETARNVQELRKAAKNATKFREKCEKPNHAGSLPSRLEIEALTEEAHELRPRLVLEKPDSETNFRAEIFAKAKKDARRDLRSVSALIAIAAVAGALVQGAGIALINRTIEQTTPPGALGPYYADILRITSGALYQGNALAEIIFILALLIMTLALYSVWYMQDTWLVIMLFDHPSRRAFFSKINSLPPRKTLQIARSAVVIFGLLMLGLAFYTTYTLWTDIATEALIRNITPFAVGSGVLLVIAVSMPVLGFYGKEFTGVDKWQQADIQRYFIYILIKFLTLPLAILLLARMMLPTAVRIHENIYQNAIVPAVQTKLLEERLIIEGLQVNEETDQRAQSYVSKYVVDENLKKVETIGSLTTQQGIDLLELSITTGLNIIAWWALTAYLLLFVLPYLMLGGWARGIFYMLVLAASFWIEEKLSSYAPSWFRLPTSSISAALLVAFFVFANALFFDWVFEALGQKEKACPACEAILNKEDLYCPKCGFIQE